jgi:hypothetical protein
VTLYWLTVPHWYDEIGGYEVAVDGGGGVVLTTPEQGTVVEAQPKFVFVLLDTLGSVHGSRM